VYKPLKSVTQCYARPTVTFPVAGHRYTMTAKNHTAWREANVCEQLAQVPVLVVEFITFRMSRRRREMYCGQVRLCVCLCVCRCICLSAAECPHYSHYCADPDVTWRNGRDAPWLCTVGVFAIGARVALLWQHNANAKC